MGFILLACGVGTASSHAGDPPLAERTSVETRTSANRVPLKANWPLYAEQDPVSFRVPDCGGGPIDAGLPQAAARAARAWNRTAGRDLIRLQRVDCTRSGFRDGRNAIYAVQRLEPDGRLASHRSLFNRAYRDLREQDVQLSREALRPKLIRQPAAARDILANVVLHELGHALGLGHLRARPGNCGRSVMRERLCSLARPQQPTPADRDALDRLYELGGSSSSSSTADPSQPPKERLAEFDRNGNGRLDDSEFLLVVERWSRGELATPLLHRALEVWQAATSLRSLGPPPSGGHRQEAWVFAPNGRKILHEPCTHDAKARVRQQLQRRVEALDSGPRTFLLRLRDCERGRVSRSAVVVRPN